MMQKKYYKKGDSSQFYKDKTLTDSEIYNPNVFSQVGDGKSINTVSDSNMNVSSVRQGKKKKLSNKTIQIKEKKSDKNNTMLLIIAGVGILGWFFALKKRGKK